MRQTYTIGVDLGTLSARAVLVNTANGKIVAEAVFEYPHGVMDRFLPDDTTPLPQDFALQHPGDYLQAFGRTVSAVIGNSGVDPNDIIGIGIDTTSCTMLPLTADGTPLCFLPEFAAEPHAYVKLWKHHGAQAYADKMNEQMAQSHPELLARMGGKISSEWFFPKLMETVDKAPKVYEKARYFMEAGDYLTWMLTGKPSLSYVIMSFKALYHNGYPGKDFFKALDPRLENVIEEKLDLPVITIADTAGFTAEGSAHRFGLPEDAPWLCPGTAVACPVPDAHCAAPALNAVHAGDLYASFGTSSNYMLQNNLGTPISGICGMVKDGIVPGLYAYEAGLCCFGDHFAWLSENVCTKAYLEEAKENGVSVIQLLSEKAAKLKPGESGILALNWWNGNRNILDDASLSGMFVGMTLTTRPEDLFRGLVEANAFGTRRILENFRDHGVKIEKILAAGGIAQKSPFILQLVCDVLGKPIYVAQRQQAAALGAAIYAAAAAGEDNGGYASVPAACEKMADSCSTVYTPDPEAKKVYDLLYGEYLLLHDYFGRGGNDVMKRLKNIKNRVFDA